MARRLLLLATVTTGAAAAGTGRTASDGSGHNTPAALPWLLVGARVGVSYEYAKPSEFNSLIQPFFPSSNSYFPVYGTLGLSLTERFRIANTGFLLTLT